MIVLLVEELAEQGMKNEALGICRRHAVEQKLSEEVKEMLKDVVYDEVTDTSIRQGEDVFGPISKPKEKYLHLPDDVKVEWIDSED